MPSFDTPRWETAVQILKRSHQTCISIPFSAEVTAGNGGLHWPQCRPVTRRPTWEPADRASITMTASHAALRSHAEDRVMILPSQNRTAGAALQKMPGLTAMPRLVGLRATRLLPRSCVRLFSP